MIFLDASSGVPNCTCCPTAHHRPFSPTTPTDPTSKQAGICLNPAIATSPCTIGGGSGAVESMAESVKSSSVAELRRKAREHAQALQLVQGALRKTQQHSILLPAQTTAELFQEQKQGVDVMGNSVIEVPVTSGGGTDDSELAVSTTSVK